MLKKINQKGFTIVELLIVIVVIGILAALVISTFSGVQARARDAQRQTDVKAIATQLEAYYVDHSSYPTAANVNPTTLKGMDAGALQPPSSTATALLNVTAAPTGTAMPTCGTTASTGCPANQEAYQYRCTVSGSACSKFIIYYWEENTPAIKSVSSLN